MLYWANKLKLIATVANEKWLPSVPLCTICRAHVHTAGSSMRYSSPLAGVCHYSYLHCTGDIINPLSSLHLGHHLYAHMHTPWVRMRMVEERKQESHCSSDGVAQWLLASVKTFLICSKPEEDGKGGKNPGQEDSGRNEIEELKWRISGLFCPAFCFTFQIWL